MKYFYDFQVCYYDNSYVYSAQRYKTSPSKSTVLEFEITKGGHYYFTANQINTRFFRPEDSKKIKILKF